MIDGNDECRRLISIERALDMYSKSENRKHELV